MSNTTEKPEPSGAEHITSAELGALVIDALHRAKIVKSEDVERAIRIAAEEIEVRRVLGDY